MTSLAKISSNRSNSRKSAGPKTANGKSRSRFNAVKSGIYAVHRPLPSEDQKAYQRLSRRLRKRYQPSGPVEELLADQILGHIWRIQRLERAEKAYLQAIDETCCSRQVQNIYALEPFTPASDGNCASKPPLLNSRVYLPLKPKFRGRAVDEWSRTLLEAAISRDETCPLAKLMAQRTSLMDEILWLENKLKGLQRQLIYKTVSNSSLI